MARTPNTYADSNGRKAYIEWCSDRGEEDPPEGQWEGWFPDEQGITYIAPTKPQLMADMGVAKS